MKLLPLGSVFQIHNHKAIVIGYASKDNRQATTYGYLAVAYPIGFTNIEKAVFIPHDANLHLLSEGYKTSASEAFLNKLANSLEQTQAASFDNLSRFNDLLKSSIAAKKEGEAT